MRGDLGEQLRQSQAFLEMFARAWSAEYAATGGTVFCGKGCSACCSLMVNCTLTEALQIAPLLDEQQAERVGEHAERLRSIAGECGTDLKELLRRHRREAGGCPLLDQEGACSVYCHRPLTCRSLIATRESRWCGADFGSLTAEEKEAFVESLDRAVVAFPLHYAAAPRETGQELEGDDLKRQRERFGFSLYGSLPVLLHLLREKGLQNVCADGYAAVAALVRNAGYDNPLLVSLEVMRDD